MYGGSVLSISTVERAWCEITRSQALTIRSTDALATLCGPDGLTLTGDTLDIARCVLSYFAIDPAETTFALSYHSDLPRQSGLSGSTALVAATMGAVARFLGIDLNRWDAAETARKIEARGLGVLCGFQDQHMAAFGGLNYMEFRGKESLEQRHDDPLAVVEPLQEHVPTVPLLLANTGVIHHSGSVHRSPRERWLAGENEVIDAYARIAALARRAKRALLDADWAAFGALMNENHAIVADLGGSGPENERLIAAARGAGAWGAKLAGAGGGGTIVALTDDPAGVGEALLAAGANQLLTPCPSPGLTVTVS